MVRLRLARPRLHRRRMRGRKERLMPLADIVRTLAVFLPIALCCGAPVVLLLLLARHPAADPDDSENPSPHRARRDWSDP
jgi:hypothetical protein